MWRAGLAVLALALVAPSAAARDAEPQSRIEFRTVARDNNGVVRCGLFTKDGWLRSPVQSARARLSGRVAVCEFRNVKPGVYAVSAFHDANDNGKLDKNFIGIPTEGFCASRDARAHFGPPKFEDARFRYTGGSAELRVRMRYF